MPGMGSPTLHQAVAARRAYLGMSRHDLNVALTDGEGLTAPERARLSAVLRGAAAPRPGELDAVAGALGLASIEGIGWGDVLDGGPLVDRADLWRRVHVRRAVVGGPTVDALAGAVFPDVPIATARVSIRRLLDGRRADGREYTEPLGARRQLAAALGLGVRDLDEGARWMALVDAPTRARGRR